MILITSDSEGGSRWRTEYVLRAYDEFASERNARRKKLRLMMVAIVAWNQNALILA